MAVSFQIDGADMPLDPEEVKWDEIEWVARKHGGGPLVNTKRTARLHWDMMTIAHFTTLDAKCDSAAHSIKIPHPNTGTYTTFATTYLKMTGPPNRTDIVVNGVEMVADFITVS